LFGLTDRIYVTIKAQAGHLDVLMANAGVYEFGVLGEITEEQFDKTFNTDVRGLLFTVQKGAAIAGPGVLGDPHRLYGVDQGLRRLLGVQRVESRGTLARPYLDRRP
jgi:NAD(P)-dependent dehydrogenase (short-subunit alcohol dehydrogenase family)